jgi:primosomal protein N' (replication factor Y)
MGMIAKIAVAAASFAIDKLYDYSVPETLEAKAKPGSRVVVPFSRGNRRTEGMIFEISQESVLKNLKCIDEILDEEPVLSPLQLRLALWMKSRFFCTVFEAVKAMLPAGLWFHKENMCAILEGVEKDKAYIAAGNDKTAVAVLDELFRTNGSRKTEELLALFGKKADKALRSLQKSGVLTYRMSLKPVASGKTANFAELIIPADAALDESERKKKSAPQQSEILRFLSDFGEADIKDICYFTGAKTASIRALEKAGLVAVKKREIFRKPEIRDFGEKLIENLNESQTRVYDEIGRQLESGKAGAVLLYGVTGSGKTAVYIKLISDVIKKGRKAIVLVPEIALTPQLVSVFVRHFGQTVAVLHSSLSIGERYDEWRRIAGGSVDVVVGTRSAVFAPIDHLGLLIIDEEQEHTYKSERAPRYHARDVAKFLCVHNEALLLLGSATPSVESMYYASTGKYALCRMDSRYNEMKLPDVMVADMKKELREGGGGVIGSVLKNELQKNLNCGEQSILFINRRGTNSIITCPECGYLFSCPECSVNLTYHSVNKRVMCHYCGYSEKAGDLCPKCGGFLKYIGYGTQKVESELRELFPEIGLLRMDADTVTAMNSHETILTEFAEKKVPVLIGTQMVTKGLNFDNVTLVGVISADQSLYAGDYRAHERTFSLITQVVGRSGRGSKSGRAVIQTFTPENEVIKLASRQDYDAFFRREIMIRRILRQPPATELYCLTASGFDEQLVLLCCYEMKKALESALRSQSGVTVLGPAPASVLKVKNRYRYRIFISCQHEQRVRALVAGAVKTFGSDKRFRGVTIFGDHNPQD